ncbi:MAG: orotate phosphoribosyltransferase [Chitinophagia bacterium]|nr:orotate phosphoribosyltransferase [Chitinophagia bacterium]
MTITASQVADHLLKIKAIKLQPKNPFTWASGLKSPIYCDNRVLLSYPAIRKDIIQAFREKSSQFEPFDVVAGVATAGIAHGALLAEALDKPFIYVRSKAKAHGMQNLIEGYLPENSTVLVIEDLISTGKSSLAACKALLEEGAQIKAVLAIFSYGFDIAKEVFDAENIPTDTLSNYARLIEVAYSTNYINEEERNMLNAWNSNPKQWAEKYNQG